MDGEVLLERRPPAGILGRVVELSRMYVGSDIVDWCRDRLGLTVIVERPWTVVRQFQPLSSRYRRRK